MHKREAIIIYIVELLTLLVESVGGRVYKGRVYPMDTQALPGICVFIEGETSSLVTTAAQPRTSGRVLEINLEIYVKGDVDVIAALNDIAAEVETALGQDLALGGLALDLFVSAWAESLNANQTDRSQAQKTGVGTMTYSILYDVAENNPQN